MQKVLTHIHSDKPKKVIIDTDSCNEVDDQFAIAYALGCDKLEVLSINAVPFYNDNSTGFKDGMEKSYNEILRVLAAYGKELPCPVYRGSDDVIEHTGKAIDSPAARNIIDTAMAAEEPIYVLGLGAATNIASALMMEPAIKEKIVVIWLGGNSIGGDNLAEFNLMQDYAAGQVLLDSGVPLVLCPAWNVTCVLYANLDEFKRELQGGSTVCELLWQLINEFYHKSGCLPGYGRTIWDIAAVAILSKPECGTMKIVPAPIFSDEKVYKYDDSRHEIIYLEKLDRDMVYADAWPAIKGLACSGEYIPRWSCEE